ncbi:phytanoyl-CoA dioxygenase family protein [Arenicellales bacterium nBUS_45]
MNIERFDKSQLVLAKQYYDEFGFVIIKDGIDKPVLDDLEQEFLRIIRAYLCKADISEDLSDKQVFHRGMELLEGCDHMFVASIYDTISLSPVFLRIVSSGLTEKWVRFLLGKKNVPLYGFTNRCLIAPPSDERKTYGWHQEVFYTVPRGSYIQTWAPLISDTSILNGTIQIAPGSHREGVAKQTWNEIDGRATQIIIDDQIMAKYDQVSVEMQLGELLLFSGYLAHRSGNNSSDEHRYSLVGMYHDVSAAGFLTPSVSF